MKRLFIVCSIALLACNRSGDALKIPTGSHVTVQKTDGVAVEGKLVDVSSDRVVVEQPNGDRAEVRRSNISAINAAPMPDRTASAKSARDAEAVPAPGSRFDAQPVPTTGTPNEPIAGAAYREVTIPAGTVLPIDLETPVGSDISRVEQPVRGHLRRALTVRGMQVLPAGATVLGNVTAARRPGRVKGRGYVAMNFNEIEAPGEGKVRINTATVSRMAPATKGKDAIEILAPAAGGAVLGRVLGGKKGAREGAVIGGGAGAGYVLSTRGKEVRLGKGANLAVRLKAPVTVRVH